MRLIKIVCLVFIASFLSIDSQAQSQKDKSNKNISTTEKKILDQGLVDIQSINPEILVELKYATPDNFMKKNVYGDLTHAYLQPEMATKLSKASTLLKQAKPGYKLLVYDAARPNSAQYKLWDALDDLKIPPRQKTQYVADPKIGSNHNFGCAIDLTVVDEKGIPLDMGTKYDFFGPLAYPRSEQEMLKQGKLTAKQISNRNILRKAMVQSGFTVNTTEWWHFDGMSKKQARAKYGMIK
ncbi:D-alanyl-D-alanine dipeptidase [Dyadobacter koreensis]|uniref:D-alanyl-D-alanine dipeptidase n=1 Tax=Dyadobacter koreensis TaxID=408657 RepID=A0A1H6RKD3_9BACT|nr:M15 family metallopeptidase [Dyadobacter koreensis]SEI53764.1 D-alanyl-D-alanine dipeptidase [Dyadobacter koreensis]